MLRLSKQLQGDIIWLRAESESLAEQSRDHYRLASSIPNLDARAIWVAEAESLAARSFRLAEIANNIENF